MKKVGIICNLMGSYGGVQTCVLSLIKGLNNVGIEPVLISNNVPNKKLWLEQKSKCDTKFVNYSISHMTYKKYEKILAPIWEFVFFFKTSWLDEAFDFIYIFEPNVIVNNNQKHLFYLSMSPRANNFSERTFFSKAKTFFYKYFFKRVHPIFEFQNYNCVINSNYTASMYKDYYKKDIDVIYPSNSVENLIGSKNNKEQKSVIFLSRLSPKKKVENIIELASLRQDFSFYVLGGVSSEDEQYVEKIRDKVKLLKLKNIFIKINLPYLQVIEYLKKAKYYVFFSKNEHFGITTVESMLFGCIPFVHNSGGQKEIVLDERLRFEYDNMLDKFEALIAMDNESQIEIEKKIENHIRFFKENIYINKMLKYISKC